MADRFDLETQITNLYNVTDDLQLLENAVLERDDMTSDDIFNTLVGVRMLLTLRIEQLFTTFTEVFHLDGFAAPGTCEDDD